MAHRKYNRPDGDKLLQMAASGMTFKQIADILGISRNVVCGAIRAEKLRSKDTRKHFDVVNFGQPLKISGNALIVGDVHSPITLYDFAQLVVKVAKHHSIKILIIAGDLLNMDFVSKYPAVIQSPSWAQERDATRVLLKEWTDYFEQVYIIMGNHERRIQKVLAGAFEDGDLFGVLTTAQNVTTSNFGYMFLRSGDQDWLVTHSTDYSKNQLVATNMLAQKYQMNVISHHEHHAAKGLDEFKRYVIINNGGLGDWSKLVYKNIDTSKKGNMANAFATIINGVGELYTPYPAFTDWSKIFGVVQ